MLTSALGSSGMNGIIRFISGDIHAFEIAFFRNLFGFIALTPVLWHRGLDTLATSRFPLHAVRGVFNAIAMLSFFYAVGITPLATVAALSFTAPLFATLLAIPVLGEKVGPRRWAGLGLGFLGAVIILRPGLDAMSLGALLVVFSSLCWACALVIIKILSRTDTSVTITCYAAFFLTPTTFVCALFVWTWPTAAELGLLFAIGCLGTITQVGVAQAFREADASLVLPFDFTKLIWSALIGYFAFAEVPDLGTLLGGTIIAASASYIAYREARIAKAPVPG